MFPCGGGGVTTEVREGNRKGILSSRLIKAREKIAWEIVEMYKNYHD